MSFIRQGRYPNGYVVLLGLGTFLIHIMTAGHYGYHRDELYFLACAKRLAWGYVDQPPMIALIAKAVVLLFGQSLSLYALRLFPALAAAGIVVSTGSITARLGGGTIAQTFAMLAVLCAPFYLAVGNLLTMNAFEPLIWMLLAYLIIELFDARWTDTAGVAVARRSRLWPALGVVTALGVLTKYTVGFFALSLCLAIIVGPERRLWRESGFWLAIAIALLLTAPNLWWQHSHAWPQIELLRSAIVNKDVHLGIVGYLLSEILMVNPLTFPLWAAGLIFFFRCDNGRYRLFFWSYTALFIVYVALHAKVYYLAPIYPLLFAGGACALESWLASHAAQRIGYAAALLVVGALIVPQVLPILPLPTFLVYQRIFDFRQIKAENHTIGRVPQHYADMLGWDRLVLQIASIYRSLPPAQRARAAVWTENYGQAAAVDFFGPAYALPPAISGHNSYYLWGPRGYDGSVLIAVGVAPSLTHAEFRSVVRVATFVDHDVMPYQDNLPIEICTQPIRPLQAFWPRVRAYY